MKRNYSLKDEEPPEPKYNGETNTYTNTNKHSEKERKERKEKGLKRNNKTNMNSHEKTVIGVEINEIDNRERNSLITKI